MVLAVGVEAPDFTLSDQHGEELTLSELVEEGPVALVFFPHAFTGICTGELCELRDNLALFDDGEVRLLGVSVDPVPALRAWAEQEGRWLLDPVGFLAARRGGEGLRRLHTGARHRYSRDRSHWRRTPRARVF